MLATLKALAVCAALGPTLALAQPSSDWRDGPGPWHMMWWGGWGWGWIFPLLMMVFFVVLCAFLMTRMGGHGHFHRGHADSALQILNERFAKGEISREEFEERRALLVRRV